VDIAGFLVNFASPLRVTPGRQIEDERFSDGGAAVGRITGRTDRFRIWREAFAPLWVCGGPKIVIRLLSGKHVEPGFPLTVSGVYCGRPPKWWVHACENC
jgi:hypothetical protein